MQDTFFNLRNPEELGPHLPEPDDSLKLRSPEIQVSLDLAIAVAVLS